MVCYLMKRSIFSFTLLLLCMPSSQASDFNTKISSALRIDDRSSRDARFQYKLSVTPSFRVAQNWSLHGYAITGDDFSSSHNTINASTSDSFYLRRLFVRYESENTKTEVGVIPTYKGRVSSTGLSKEGWIQGIRHVVASQSGKFEWVVGELSDTRASQALGIAEQLNFIEVEFSSSVSNDFAYELGFERILNANYARGEMRFSSQTDVSYGLEIIGNIAEQEFKYVASLTSEFKLMSLPAELFIYYSFVDDNFGQRAELTEDFLSTGHGFSAELESSIESIKQLNWFSKIELYEGNSRIQLGLKYSLSL